MTRLVMTVVVAAWLVGGPVDEAAAQQGSRRNPGKARSAYGIRWRGDLASTLAAARRGPRKPVLWLRMLGELEGAT